jgi:hypothetical protein
MGLVCLFSFHFMFHLIDVSKINIPPASGRDYSLSIQDASLEGLRASDTSALCWVTVTVTVGLRWDAG